MRTPYSHLFHAKGILRAAGRAVVVLIALSSLAATAAPFELIYQEGFNNDGSAATPPRYTIEGHAHFELPEILENGLDPANQLGPIYWAHSFEVSLVGVPPATKARRMLFAWDAAITEAEASPEMLALF